MNEVFPDGTILVCIHPILLRQDPAQGDYVIVQRIDDTSQGELTVKQYALDDEGRPYLWPRSSHPDHQQPIRFPDADEFDQRNDIQVTGIVIGSYRLEGSMNPVRREA